MRSYLGLLATALRNAVPSKHELVLENPALRQQLAVLTRQRSRRPNEASRPPLLVMALQVLGRLALPARDRAAGDGRPLAPHRLAYVLDVEE